MRGTINIGGKDVEMVANAASPHYYKEIFKEDFLQESQKTPPDTGIFEKMGFVMAKQAEGLKHSEMLDISVDSFFEWLVQFEPMDILEAIGEISNLYMKQTEPSSIPKQPGG